MSKHLRANRVSSVLKILLELQLEVILTNISTTKDILINVLYSFYNCSFVAFFFCLMNLVFYLFAFIVLLFLEQAAASTNCAFISRYVVKFCWFLSPSRFSWRSSIVINGSIWMMVAWRTNLLADQRCETYNPIPSS